MKINISSQHRSDALGLFTYLHPRAMWTVDIEKKTVEALKSEMSLGQRDKAIKVAVVKKNKEMSITFSFIRQYVESKELLIPTEMSEVQTASDIKKMVSSAMFKADISWY